MGCKWGQSGQLVKSRVKVAKRAQKWPKVVKSGIKVAKSGVKVVKCGFEVVKSGVKVVKTIAENFRCSKVGWKWPNVG